ncbi:uncharacterized protein [Asterias amurensis]|uniref:uncharacterized protein isoform X2 n=1 Tax=Asterias amurensis TaxID=7602 RepID=UPI003AB83C85
MDNATLVLSKTQVTVPKDHVHDRPLDGKWTENGPKPRRHSGKRYCIKRNTKLTADETSHITSHTQGGKDNDEDAAPSSCICSPLKMHIRRWRKRRQSKVVPLSKNLSDNNMMRVHGGVATPVTPMKPDTNPFCLGDVQKIQTPEVAINASKLMIPNLLGLVTTEIDTFGQESHPSKIEVLSNEGTRGQIFPSILETSTAKDLPLQKHKPIFKVAPALSDYQQAKTTKMSPNEDHLVSDVSRESICSLRPKTSRGTKQDLDLVIKTDDIIKIQDSMFNVWTREENKQEHIDSDDENLVVPGLEITGNVLSGDELNLDTNTDESDGENNNELADLKSSDDEYDSWVQIEEAVAASRMSSRMNVEKQRDEVSQDQGERGNDVVPGEIQYELKQREQWQLAAIGEWSVICQDDDEVNDDYSQSYLMKDEFQKEQEIREDWRPILDRHQSLSIIQDLRTMQTLSKCTISQSERAMRQFARICRGPVPFSHSGQTKTEAIASLSRKVQRQTKRISEEISNTFMEFYHIFEEIDDLREKQDRVEDFFQKDLVKRDSEKQRASAPPPRSATPRRSSSRLQQWELDINLMDTYSEGRVRSSSLITIMPTIGENDIYTVPERSSQLSRSQCQEIDYDSDDFPEYNGMDYVSPVEGDDVTPVDDTDNKDNDVTFHKIN